MAAVDMFLKLDGVKGESHDAKHLDEIEISSFSWGVSQAGAFGTGGGGSGKVAVHDISITKRSDVATPALLKSCASGKHIATGLITVRKAGEKPVEYLKIKLVDVLISSVQMGGHSTSIPQDQVSLDFHEATFTVWPLLATGGLGTPLSAQITNEEQGQLEQPPPAPPA
jgi:type VI secretion system secreted protein Hcp